MRWILWTGWTLWMLAMAPAVWGQVVVDMGVDILFTSKKTWISTPTDSTFKVITSTANADTFETRELTTVLGGGEIYVNARVVKSVSGTINSKLQVGLYRGEGSLVGGGGYEWLDVLTFDAVAAKQYSLKDLVAVADRPFSKFKFRFLEIGDQSSEYVLWVHHYRPGGR